jgi:hypothetical protein
MGGMEVIGQSGGVLNGGDPKGGDACPPVEIPTVSVMTSTPDPFMAECRKADLDTGVGAEARSLDL